MQGSICDNFTRRKMFQSTSPWESINKLHHMQYHADNHNAWHLSKGKLWWRERIFSLRNLMFCLISPQCCKAAAQSMLGIVGRPTTMSLMMANLWSPFITTIQKPLKRYILYVASKATQMMSFELLLRWVIVVKHILVLKVVKNTCLLTKKQSIANSTSCLSLMSSLGTLSASSACHSVKLYSLSS